MGESAAIVVTLIIYKVVLLGIGFWFSRKSGDGVAFHLGGRGLGPWVAAISSAASSSSAWTLLGVSGAAFHYGLGAIWILPACLGGFVFNWFVVAKPMRRLSRDQDSVTMIEALAHGAPPRMNRAITISAAIVVLLSLGVYVASQFQAAGKTFAEVLDMDDTAAILTGGGIVLIYVMSGGFWAASVSDLVQGIVMASAATVVPVVALVEVGGPGGMLDGLRAIDPQLTDVTNAQTGWTLVAFVLGFLGIGLGYPGQPHVVNRYMALRAEEDIVRGRRITIGWASIIYTGMLFTGWCGRVFFEAMDDREAVLLRLTTELFPPVVAGVIVAAVLSAMMSTADSQLLVCGSTVSHDLPHRSGTRKSGLDRLAIVGISLAAIVAALTVDQTIFSQVLYAWSALGAAFGPLLLCRLLRGPVRPGWTLAAIWTGFLVTVVWYSTLKPYLYELVPAFLAALGPAWIGSRGARGPAPADRA